MKDPLLQKYHRQGFWIKVFSALAFTAFCIFVRSDSTSLYFPEGKNIYSLILKDPSYIKLLFIPSKNFDESLLADPWNVGYFAIESNYAVVRLVAVLCFFTFGKYLLLNLFFSLIAYSGAWRLYKFFYELYPHLHKQIAIAVLYFPTFIFWSSGVMKDPICITMLGWMTYCLYSAFVKKKNITRNVLIAVVSGYILATVKMYILVSYLPFFIVFIIMKNVGQIRNTFLKIVFGFALSVFAVIALLVIAGRLKEELGIFAMDKLAESVKAQQGAYIALSNQAESSFSLGEEFDGSISSLIKTAPAAIIVTLYRPFLWESKKISTLLSSLESLAMMLFTLYVLFKVGLRKFVSAVFRDPAIFYCFFFSVVFALFVGITTLNFGTLVRYKIPCLPFYLIGLFLIEDRYRKQAATKVFKSQPDSIMHSYL